MSNISTLEINKSAIAHNLSFFKSKLKKTTKILVVVKAFSYGSDAVLVSKILQNKVDYLAVAYTKEGITLRNAGIKLPILVLHPQISNLELLIKYNLEPNIYSFTVFTEFVSIAQQANLSAYPIHLKFNTGLNRLGFSINDVKKIISLTKKEKSVKIASVFSHLAASEDLNEKQFTLNQINSFKKVTLEIENLLDYKPIFHILNTSGIVNYTEYQFDMVRLGIGIYGFANDKKTTNKLKNVVSLKSVISQIHVVEKGNSIGYNRAFKTTSKTKTATIPIGHADGISRKLGNGNFQVLINNQKASSIGNVCMDMIMVNVTNIDCKEGDEVVIFNSQESIHTISNKLETIPYELLTMISQRVQRVVV